MKRFLSLLVALSVTFGIITPMTSVSAVNEETSQVPAAVKFLSDLGVVEIVDDSMLDIVVTREDFAVYTANLIGIDTSVRATERYFEDMAMTSYGTYAVNCLVERGILSKSSDNRFRPDAPISQGEAAKILCEITGYGEYAQLRGGFPAGYIRAAKENDFLVSLKDSGQMTVSDAVKMIYKAAQAKMYEPVIFSTDGTAQYSQSNDCTVLSLYHNIYYADGVVTGVYGRSIESGNAPGEGRIRIDNREYDAEDSVNIDENLGEYVRYFYIEDNKNPTGKIVFVDPKIKKETVKFAIRDLIKFDETEITYYGSNDRENKKKLINPIVVYNGLPVNKDIDELIRSLNKGFITLKDINNQSGYEIVLIDDYTTIVASNVDSVAGTVYNQLNSKDYIKCEDYEVVKFYNSAMEPIALSDIKTGNVLSLAKSYKSNDLLTVIVSTVQMNGTLNSRKGNNPLKAYIAGKEYTVDNKYAEEFMKLTNIGVNYYYSFDFLDDIVFVSEESTDVMKFGYVLDAIKSTYGFNSSVNIKMFTEDAKISYLTLADSVKIDGKRYKDNVDKAFTAFFLSNNGSKREMLVRYNLNSDGFIDEVDTAYINPGYETDRNSLSYVYEDEFVRRHVRTNRYGLKAYVNSNTKLFRMPADSIFGEVRERDLKVDAGTALGDDGYRTCMVYTTNVLNEYSSAIIDKYTYSGVQYNRTQPVFLVSDIQQGLDSDGSVVNVLCGYLNGTYTEYKLDEKINVGDVEQGDLVKLHFDINNQPIPAYDGISEDIVVLYDYSKYQGKRPDDASIWKGMVDGGPCYLSVGTADSGGYSAYFQLSFGFAHEKVGGMIRFGYNSGAEFDEVFRTSSVKVTVYDKEMPDDRKVYVGSINDINDYKSVGNDCSSVIVHTYTGSPMSMVVYK